MNMFDINIVIVNWKMRDDIDRCLSSLFKDVEHSDMKLIVHVVDNSQNADGIKDLLNTKYPQVVYRDPGGNIGFGKAQNLGFSLARARFYLPLNPDIEFLPGDSALSRIISAMEEKPEIGIASPKHLNDDGSIQASCYRFPNLFDQFARRLNLDKKFGFLKKNIDRYLMADFDHNSSVPVDWVMGSFMLVKKEVAEKIGFFDDRYFMYFEDCDWCRRTWRAGWKVYYVHDAVVRHGHRRESSGKSPLLSVLKNPVTRIHLKSWFQYFMKWGLKKEHFGI